MKKPALVVMAAGMGSRYGGLKQIDPVDKDGDIIIDFSIYDAIQAGFEKIVFIIKKENEADFRAAIGDRMSKHAEVVFVFQDLHNLPEGFEVPQGRVKPWGTGHAIMSCMDVIDGPFAVINADDYYGRHAFQMAYDFLTQNQDKDGVYQYMMVGYKLENTLTDNGHVARGVCVTDEEGYLKDINERTHIEKKDGGAAYTEDDGATWNELPMDATVSMNMWGFSASILKELKDRFPAFLKENVEKNPLKCEYFLPFVVDELLCEKKATVKVLKSMDKWYGVTYKEDKPVVMNAVQRMKDEGMYPQKLWVIDGPFAVINADDYYGRHAFQMAYDFLTQNQDKDGVYQYMMVGYKLENTLTDNGHVARGVCVTDEEGYLKDINERTHIEKKDGGAAYTEDDGATWNELPMDATVSMNMWGFSASILKELKDRFPAFLKENVEKNPLKCEYFLPFVVDELLCEKKATVKVLKSMDKWYGVTYKEDKPVVMNAVQRMKDEGMYPQKLWED